MKEKGSAIIKKISTILSQINSEEHLYKIKNCNNLSECLLISKKFCETITNTKTRLIFDISEEFNAIVVHKEENLKIGNKPKNNIHISKINDDLSAFIKNIKDIVTQTNNKIKSLLLNTNDLSNSLSIISGNLLKMKYSLASARIDKLFQLKNTMVINIKSLEILETQLSETLKIDQLLADKIPNNNINIKFQNNIKNVSPSPIHTFSNSDSIEKKNSIYKREKISLSNNRDKSIDIVSRNKSAILTNITNACNKVRSRSFIELKTIKRENDNNLKYIESLKKKLLAQRTIIEKLKKEKENFKKKNYLTISNNNNNKFKIANTNNDFNTNKNNKLLLPIICNKNHLLIINEKLNKSSDFVFAITFLINSIQNKNNKISSEPEYENIKMNLLKITTEISELKSYLLKISLESEINDSQNTNNKNDSHNNSIANTNSEIDLLKAEINSLNQKLSDEQCQKESLQKEINKIAKENLEIKNNNENNVSSLSTNNSVIITLKEQLRVKPC